MTVHSLRCGYLQSVCVVLAALVLLFTGSPGGAAELASGQGVFKDGQRVEGFSGRRSVGEVQRITESEKTKLDAGIASQDGEQGTANRKLTSQHDFSYAIHSLVKTLDEMDEGKGRKTSDYREPLQRHRLAVETTDRSVAAEFQKVEQNGKDAGFSDVILERHRVMVENHRMHTDRLLADLGELEQAVGHGDSGRAAELSRRIRELLAEKRVVMDPPLLHSAMPHEISLIDAPSIPLERITPVSVGPSSQKDLKTNLTVPVRSSDTVQMEFSPQDASVDPPLPGDLAATIDVQLTPEIASLTTKLGKSPLELYRYVRDNFDFESYLGSRKGSQETLNQKSGNDYDQSSLLIALLRSSGIPARYVRGIVELPVETAKNWLGVDDGSTAGSILTTAGMEGVNIVDGNGKVVSIRFRHVWVEAYLPYANYRGVPIDQSGKMWVPLDPSLKNFTLHPGLDIPTEMGFNAQSFTDSYITTFHSPSPVELFIQQIKDYLAANHAGMTYDDVIRTRSINAENLGLLPGSTPFTVRSIDSRFSEIPADKRYKVGFHLYNNSINFINYTANLPAIAGKRVTISYVAATAADQTVIDSYGDLYKTPPYLVKLRPILKIDGVDVAVGTAGIGMGVTHNSDMTFTAPTGAPNVMPLVSNTIIAGTYQAIGICTKKIATSVFDPPMTTGTITIDDWTGGKLWRTAMGYLDRVRWAENEVAKTMGFVVTNDVSEAIVENAIQVTYSYGTPNSFKWTGLTVDADRDIVGPFAVNGGQTKNKSFMILTGADGSISENRIFEDTYDEEAISTIKILELAADMKIPACRITSSISAQCPGLSVSSAVLSAVTAAVAAGHVVTIPQSEITYSQWHGTGYIDMNPATGAAGYIISGGAAGGATVDVWVSWKMIWFTIFRDLCDANPITAAITYPAANDYFPALGWMDFLSSNKLHFDVNYTICYKNVGIKTVSESYWPSYPYGPGDYIFNAGWGTGKTVGLTVFGVEIDKVADVEPLVGGDKIPLKTKFTPRAPPSVNYAWKLAFCLLGCGEGTFSAANSATTDFEGTKGGDRDIALTASNANGSTDGKMTLNVVEVKFAKRSDTAFGYDDGLNTDNPVPKTVYNPPQSFNWISVNRDSKTTDVDVTIIPDSMASKVQFTVDSAAIADAAPSSATATPQKLTITGKGSGETFVTAHLAPPNGAKGPQLNIASYKLVSVIANFYKVSAPGLVPDSTTAAQMEKDCNSFLNQAVVDLTLTDNGTKNINYDLNSDGHLDVDSSADGGPEWQKLITGLAVVAGAKVLHVKGSISYHMPDGTTVDATGMSYPPWIIVTDASLSKPRTLTHETLHHLGLLDLGPPDKNTNHIMYFQSSATKNFVGYFKAERVQTGSGSSFSPKEFEQQWDTVKR